MDRGDECLTLEVFASPVLDETGNVESAVVTVQDISQRKREEAELAEYRRHLEMLVGKRTEELTATNEQLIREAAERKNLELSLHQQIEWLSVVKKVNQTITGETSLAAAYEEISASILKLLGAALVFIIHWDNQGEQVDVICASQHGSSTPQSDILQVSFQEDSPMRQEIIRGKIITWSIEQSTPIPGSLEECFQEHDLKSAIFAPVLLSQSVVGALGVAVSRPLDDFMLLQVDLVEKMAFDLAELTQDAIQHDQTKMLITAEERNRLARELHDSVTQTLFTASVLAEATPRIWDRDRNMARQNMDKLSLLIRGALAEMRSMLLELRSEELQNQTLDLLLNTLVEGARARSHAIITFSTSDIPEIPKNVTLAFYRMAREALNNTLIHSSASQVHVSLEAEPGQVGLQIQDNGCGFDPQAIPPGHLGLRILGERAAEIGGSVQIRSKPGYGTEIGITWVKQVEGPEEDE